jgi:DNA-binding NarL/FixJ family response regulator
MRVYIVSRYPAVRAGLAALLREQPGWTVVGSAAPEALGRAPVGDAPLSDAVNAPDVLLAEVDGSPDSETLDAWLTAVRPRGGILLLGAVEGLPRVPGRGPVRLDVLRELAEIARATEAQGLALGALPREATPEEVIAALTAVASGLITLDRRVAQELLATFDRAPASVAEPSSSLDEPLTARELEVLQLLAQGLPNKIIANRLRISEHTAKFHVSSIMTKLHAASRTEAVTVAARRGLLIL